MALPTLNSESCSLNLDCEVTRERRDQGAKSLVILLLL